MKVFKKRRFKVDIVFAFTLLLASTVLIITSFIYIRNRKATLRLVQDNFKQEAESIIHKTNDYMMTAQRTAESSVELFRSPQLKLDINSDLTQYMLKTVIVQTQTELFYYGDEQGNFLQAVNLGGTLYCKKITRDGKKVKTEFIYYDRSLKVIRKEQKGDAGYDPRVRPWYLGAKETGKTYWTEPYIFFESKKPGITVACPVFDKEERFKGVVAADITLSGLSEFLREIDISRNSHSFIFDNNKSLLAYPDPEKMLVVENGQIRSLKIQELKIPSIIAAIRQFEDQGERNFSFRADNNDYLACITSFPPRFGKSWLFAVVAPEDDFLGAMKDTFYTTLYLALSGLIIAILAAFLLSRQISKPIEELADEVMKVKNFELDSDKKINSHIYEIQEMDRAVSAMKNSLKAFRMYVPATLVRQLIDSGESVSVGGKDREITLFFSDIASFTSISEQIAPKDLMLQLSEYFGVITSIIEEETGTVDKFIGDAVMAFWGAPIMNDDHAVMACRAALRCCEKIDKLNEEWGKQGKKTFCTRIGIHTGYNVVGNIGSNQRLNYTVLGDGVNLANRLEGVNKIYKTSIIISGSTHRYIQNYFACRLLDQIAVKGKSQSITIYELLAEETSQDFQRFKSLSTRFSEAYKLFLERDWNQAKEAYQAILKDFPDDYVTELYIKRCDKYINQKPDDSWNGITRLETK